MNKYKFKTSATMKEYNKKKWWIDSGIIRNKYIEAENVNEAINKYKHLVEEEDYITISSNAIKNKNPMYVDTKNGEAKQVGYVVTAQTEFDDGYGRYVKQYIDLWIRIDTIVDTEF